MRTAIILSGFVRTWEETASSFNSTFSHMNPDIFVTTYNKRYGYHPHIKNKINYYDDEYIDVQKIEGMFTSITPKFVEVEDADILDKIIDDENKNMHPAMQGFNNSFGQARKLKLMVDYIQEYEKENNIVYDTIIKTRCDMLYHDNIDFNIASNEVLVDKGNVFPNDCVYMCNRDSFINATNYVFDEFYQYRNPKSSVAAPHGVLEAAFLNSNLKIITRPIMRSVLRVGGEDFY